MTANACSTSAAWLRLTTTATRISAAALAGFESGKRRTRRLLGDGRFPTPDGRARFVPVRQEGTALTVDAAYPLALNTGRLRDQWHTMTRTGSVPRLMANAPEPQIDLHPSTRRR